MVLSKTHADKIISEKTFFEVPLDINTGEVLNYDSETGLVFRVNEIDTAGLDLSNETPEVVSDKDYVIIRFNEKANELFKKYFKVIVANRGIKDVDEIDANDHDVKTMMAKARRKNKNNISKEEVSAIITRVRRMHEPQAQLASFQVLLWTILYEDMFVIKNKSIDCRFDDIDIDDTYWDGAKSKEADPLEALLNKELMPIEPFLDKEHPIEIMIAIVSQFISKYPELSEAIQEFVKKAYIGIGLLNSNQSYVDATFLAKQLDELLS